MRRLAPYPFKEKNEILDRRIIPRGRYDLEFRPPSAHPTGDVRKPLAWLWLVAACGAASVFVVRYFLAPFLDSATATGVASSIGVVLAAANLLTDWCPRTIAVLSADRKLTATILFVLPLSVWLLAIVFSRLDAMIGAYMLLALFAVPLLLKTADLITTHAVYWTSANPRIDGQTMKRWRAEWGQRFRGFPRRPASRQNLSPQQHEVLRRILDVRDHYVHGFLLVALAIVVPTIAAFVCCSWGHAAPLGPTIVVGQVCALVLVALYRTSQVRTAVHLFALALELPDMCEPRDLPRNGARLESGASLAPSCAVFVFL